MVRLNGVFFVIIVGCLYFGFRGQSKGVWVWGLSWVQPQLPVQDSSAMNSTPERTGRDH